MKIFRCGCGGTLFFENVRCLQCQREVGYSPEQGAMLALDPDARKCRNYASVASRASCASCTM